MAFEIFKLVGSVMVNTDQANKSLAKTDKQAESVGKKFISGVKTVGKWGAAIGTAGVTAGAAMYGFAKKAADAGDRVDKMSQKLGVSRKTFQELDFVCSQTGASVDGLKTGMKTLRTQMMKTQDGAEDQTLAFDKLGISVTDSNGKLRNQEDIMWEAFDALQGMENQTEKAALANELFGRAGTDLLPMLNGEKGSIEALKDKAHELGLVMSDEAVDASVEFTDKLDQTKRMLTALGTSLGVTVMPIFISAMEWIQAHSKEINKIAKEVFDVIKTVFTSITKIVKSLMPVLSAVGDTVKNVWFKGVKPLLNDITKFVESVFSGDIKGAVTALVSAVGHTFSGIVEVFKKPINKAYGVVKSVIGKIKNAFDFKVSLPNIKLPHFSIEPKGWKLGDLMKGVKPELGIEWYAKGGIMTQPTAFGVNGSNVMVGGESGPEAILPISTLKKYIRDELKNGGQTVNINFRGNYQFKDAQDIDYFMKESEKLIRWRMQTV